MESATLTPPRREHGPLARLRAAPERVWARAAFGMLCVGAAVGFLVYPTWPNYDSAYSLLWGREVLHGQLPSFDAYRTPTEHPLAVAVGAVLSVLGSDAAPRVWLALTVAAFCVLVAGMYRLGRVAFSPWVGAMAALLVLSRLDYAFLAARGYVDVPYLALVVWATALEVARPRRGGVVWVLLGLAGLLRPEAWILAGMYWVWCGWPPASWGVRARLAAPAAVAPLLWALCDLVVTGDALFSLRHTSSLAADLERTRPASAAPGVAFHALDGILKWPVLAGAAVGLVLALSVARRRALVPLAMAASGVLTFGAIAAAGLSVIDRYLAITALGLIVFAAFAIAGFTVLPDGAAARRPWMVLAAVVALGGALFTATHFHPGYVNRELSTRGDLRRELQGLLQTPAFAAARRCGPVTVPNHKLIPDTRWVLDAGADAVLARSALPDSGLRTRGVHLFVSGSRMLENTTYGPFDRRLPDDARIQVPGPGSVLVSRTPDFAVYAIC